MAFIDPTGVDHDILGLGLKKAIYNYMHGLGFEVSADVWFADLGMRIPRTSITLDHISRALYS